MTFLRTLRILVGAVFAGLIIGVAFSGDDLVSLQIWVGATAATIVAVMIRDLVVAASIETPRVSLAWTLPAVAGRRAGPRGAQNLRATLSSAHESSRTFERKLRPQLVALAEHYIPRSHGLDLVDDRSRVEELLDDTYWLIDPTVSGRSPSAGELERFVDIVAGTDDSLALERQRTGSASP